MRDNNFDFDKEFNAKVEEFELKTSEKYVLTHNVKKQIQTSMNAILLREKYYSNPKIYNEQKLFYQIRDNTQIFGVVDNLVTLDNKYYICIDYKTGSTKFDDKKLEYGESSQLPTYALLVHEAKQFKDLTPIGLYINNVLTSKIYYPQEEDELIPSYLKLNGKTIDDISKISLIDSTIADRSSSFISSVSMKIDGSLKAVNSIITSSEFDNYINIIKEKLLNMDDSLRDNVFDISPIYYSKNDNACMYCDYKDICFMRDRDYRKVREEEEEDE